MNGEVINDKKLVIQDLTADQFRGDLCNDQ